MLYEREFEVVWGDDQVALLTVTITDEGVIADVLTGEEFVGTWGLTAQELTEMIQENLG